MAQQYQVDIVTRVQGASAVAKLEAALKKVEASSKAVDNQAEGVATSLQKLKSAANQSAVANSKAALALEKLRLANLKASGSTDKAALAFQKLRVATAESAVNSAKAAASVNGLGANVQAAGGKAKASSAGFQSMGAAINAAALKITAIVTAVQTFGKVLGAAFERQNAEQRLKNLTGSTAEYEAALLAAAAMSQKFGMTQTQATQALGDVYSRLSGVGFGLKEVKTIYEGFNVVARESGVSSEAASAAFLQLGQAMGSGTLQGDELRSILEQMPQLTQAIAGEMGIAASQVKQFGADGKITSDIIYAALQKAAEGAVDLNGKLSPTQQRMNDFNKAIDAASVALGSALLPALTGILEAITPVLQAVGLLVTKLNELGLSKVFEFLISPAKIFGELVNQTVGSTEDLSAKADEAVQNFSSLPDPIQKAQEQQELLKESTKKYSELVSENSKLLQKDQNSIQRTLTVKQAVLNSEKQINDAKLQQAKHDLDSAKSQAEREQAAKRIYDLTITNAKLEYESTLAAAAAEQAKVEAALRGAEVLADQIKAEVALEQAKGNYNEAQQKALDKADQLVATARENLSAQDQITTAIKNGADAQLEAKTKAAELTMQANRTKQEVEGTNQQVQQVIQNTNNATNAANQTAAAWGRAANEASRAAGAAQTAAASGGFSGGGGGSPAGTKQWTNAYKPIVTKKLNAEGEIVDKTQKEIEREENALKLSGWKGGILKVRDGGADTFAAAAFNASWFAAGLTMSDAKRTAGNIARYGGMVGPKGSLMDSLVKQELGQYAEGGYVTGPQQAIVGEGGEPEYIIPASKMDSAMQRYGSGMRGSAVIPDSANVSINYSGSTVDMGGTSYVNQGDVNGIVKQAVNATLTTLSRSASARLNAGLR